MRTVIFQIIFSLLSLVALSACSQSPAHWWESLNAKAEHLKKIEASHHVLLAENERLKQDFFRLEREYLELKSKMASTEVADLNLRATGTLTGRALSSIAYQVPKGLKAEEQLSLAMEHFNEKRFAEAAVTIDDLQKRPEGASLVDAAASYSAGVAWYQVGNYFKAREHFEDASNRASGENREKINKKVDLWKRLINRKLLGDRAQGG